MVGRGVHHGNFGKVAHELGVDHAGVYRIGGDVQSCFGIAVVEFVRELYVGQLGYRVCRARRRVIVESQLKAAVG